MNALLSPNVPRLSCGNVQSVRCRLLRGRDSCSFQFFCLSRGAFVDGWFRQLEPLVMPQHNMLHAPELKNDFELMHDVLVWTATSNRLVQASN